MSPQPGREILPLAAMGAVAWLLGLLDHSVDNPGLYVASGCLYAALAAAMFGLANRQPQWLLRLSPYGFITAIAMLLESQTDAQTGLAIVLLLPVLAMSLRGTRRDSSGVVAALVVALLIVEQSHHVAGVLLLRRLVLWGAFGTVLSLSIHDLRDRLAAARRELEGLAMTDPLTGLANRRGFEAALRDRSGRRPFALLSIDVNRLKVLNDTRGHQAGDELIIAIGDACRQSARAGDEVARVGGDEFIMFVADADEAQARIVVDRITEAISGVRIGDWRASASIGVAVGTAGSQWEDVLHLADQHMYQRKHHAYRTAGTGIVPPPRTAIGSSKQVS